MDRGKKYFAKAMKYLKNGKTKSGIGFLEKSSSLGMEEAKFQLALESLNGNFKMNSKELVIVLKRFVGRGDSRAILSMGYCYEDGIGVRKSKLKAFKFYHHAAQLGLSDAQWNLALCYENGFGCKKDLKQAFKWYKKAALLGDAESMNSVGYCYKYGLGTKTDYAKAIDYFKASARKGYPSAFANLGSMYLSGFGVNANSTKAKKYLDKGAKLGSPLAKKLLRSIR